MLVSMPYFLATGAASGALKPPSPISSAFGKKAAGGRAGAPRCLCNSISSPNTGGVSIRSRNGAPSRKGCLFNDQMIKASNK